MILDLLLKLHRKKHRRTLGVMSNLAYLAKGFGWVGATYFPEFRAYAYRVRGKVYLSSGPGWAYNFDYLKKLLQDSYSFSYLPKEGDCVIDIGAGLGEETVVYATLVGNTGAVHALEANPNTFAGLKYMCEQNGFSWVKPHNLAIFNKDGEVTIEDDVENYLTNTINATSSASPSFTVKAETLDTFVKENNITRIDLLKVNIEGAEQFLIQGMTGSMGIIRNICVSCHDFRHVHHRHGEFYLTKDKVKPFLEANGFKTEMRSTGDPLVDDYIYATNTRLK